MPLAPRVGERLEPRGDAEQPAGHVGRLEDARRFVVREVERGLHVGADGHEIVVAGVERAAEAAVELLGRRATGALRLGADQIHDGLGHAQIHAPVEEGAAREFAGTRRPRAAGHEGGDDAPGGNAAAVGLELHDVLARVAVRGAEGEDDGLADETAIGGIAQLHEAERAGGHPRRRDLRAGAETVGDGVGASAGKPDHGDACGAGGGAHGGDGGLAGG